MGSQWRAEYPLPERTVRRLRQVRWLYPGLSVLELVGLVVQLADGTRGWGVWVNGCGLLLFLGLTLLTVRRLQRHQATATRQ